MKHLLCDAYRWGKVNFRACDSVVSLASRRPRHRAGYIHIAHLLHTNSIPYT